MASKTVVLEKCYREKGNNSQCGTEIPTKTLHRLKGQIDFKRIMEDRFNANARLMPTFRQQCHVLPPTYLNMQLKPKTKKILPQVSMFVVSHFTKKPGAAEKVQILQGGFWQVKLHSQTKDVPASTRCPLLPAHPGCYRGIHRSSERSSPFCVCPGSA